jgi:cobalt-zinc-cadmium efflux system protein
MAEGHAPHHHPAAAPRGSLDGAFRWGVALNLGYTAIEALAGFWFGSLALLADAAHNLTDVAGLLVAWGAVAASRLRPDARHTYGFGRATILAALANAVAILVGVHGAHDLNARGAYLHMAADAAVSVGVVGAAAVILATGWSVVDPLAALGVSLVIAVTAVRLLRDALHLAMDGVPPGVDAEAVRAFLVAQPGVAGIHDLHIRAHSTTLTELTAHMVMPGGHPGDAFLAQAAAALSGRFGIGRATLQVETGEGPPCRLAAQHGQHPGDFTGL